MLPLKLVRSLVLGVPMNNPILLNQNSTISQHHSSSSSDYDGDGDDDDAHTTKAGHAKKPKPRKNNTPKTQRTRTRTRTPLLLFVPTRELITDTCRLATIARDMGMDLHPTPSLSHIIFTYPSSSSSSSSPSPSPVSSTTSTSTSSSSSSSTSSSSSVLLSLPNNAVPLPFPSLSSASLSSLRSFVSLSKGLFKLVFLNAETEPTTHSFLSSSSVNWNCCSVSLFSRLSGDSIETMDGFSRALAGNGWSIFKTRMDPGSGTSRNTVVYLFRKMEVSRVRFFREKGNGNRENRIRELRLPHLDFGNAPLRILQYIVLMTDDVFYLA